MPSAPGYGCQRARRSLEWVGARWLAGPGSTGAFRRCLSLGAHLSLGWTYSRIGWLEWPNLRAYPYGSHVVLYEVSRRFLALVHGSSRTCAALPPWSAGRALRMELRE